MLTGELPFNSDDKMELVYYHLAKQPKPIVQLNSGIPAVISDIVMRMLEKDLEMRYKSAESIRHDLEKCLEQLEAYGRIDDFIIDQTVSADMLCIPQRLYGREKELEALLSAFRRAREGSKEAVLITGYSGIGKSSLVKELYKPIAESRGHYIYGKFDQYKRNMPYYALIQAFQGLVAQILTEEEAELEKWGKKLSESLGSNGKIITDMIPEVELIIGRQTL